MKRSHIALLAILFVVVIAAVGLAFGFSGSSTTVTGTVTDDGKPVAGQILFSPQTEGKSPEDSGPPVLAPIDDDGRYKVQLKTTGLYRVVVNPRDLPEDKVPKSKLAWFRRVNPGQNEMDITVRPRRKPQPKL